MAWGVIQGDCREQMAELPENSIDAIVTDPPYGLTSGGGKGFMGEAWDSAVPGTKLWVEALRVAKPGAHLVAFGGTRRWHRLACAIEDAGWELRDTLCWLYGCLSADTEILVDGEWLPYHKATRGRLALCYNVQSDAYAWQSIEELFVYDYDDTAYQIVSERTDQIVSRNHRCIVERDEQWEFALAEEVARKQEARVPILETVRGLLDTIPLPQPNASSTQPLLPTLWESTSSGAAGKDAAVRAEADGSGVCGLRQGRAEAGRVVEAGEDPYVFSTLQRPVAGAGLEGARAQGTGRVDDRGPRVVPREDVGSEQPRLEGRRDVQEEQGQLHRSEVRPVPDRIHADGSEGRVRDGAQVGCGDGCGDGCGTVPVASGVRAPCRPQPKEQCAIKPDVVQNEQRSQTVRGVRFTTSDLARVTSFHLTGKVWCVKVPTGAFVARRNDKVFVTGNSGFPKSLDVSKAIDAAAGAERAIITAPATPEGARWDGWGTALKPAHEPIILARKPLVGTVAANVIAHGVGGINIDACRIDVLDPKGGASYAHGTGRVVGRAHGEGIGFATKAGDPNDGKGRWPANVVLDEAAAAALDEAAAAALDAQTGTLTSGTVTRHYTTEVEAWSPALGSKRRTLDPSKVFSDSGGASRFFYCAKASTSEREAGLIPVPGEKRANKHPTVKPLTLMRWLVRLVTPPGGLVLDHFTGSGTTGCAAVAEGFNFLGVDQDAEYVETARRRIAHWAAKAP